MQVKDVLPYYLGSDFRVRYVDSPEGSWTVWVKLTALRLAKLDDESIEQIQLALRPLDSMTEEEAKEFIRIQDTGKDFHQKAADKVIYSYDGNGDNGKIFGVMYFKWSDPNQFHYLLSRGFDLFGLIESGAAIDSNTLTQ